MYITKLFSSHYIVFCCHDTYLYFMIAIDALIRLYKELTYEIQYSDYWYTRVTHNLSYSHGSLSI